MSKYPKIFVIILAIIILLNSCASNKNRFVYGMPLTAKERETSEIIGSVEAAFEASVRWKNDKTILDRSYYELLKIARQKYAGKIDIRNIVIEKHSSGKNFLLLVPVIFYGTSTGLAFTNIYAKGEVIRYNEN